MPGSGYVLASLLGMGAVTVALRWAPFAFIRVLRGSELVRFLGVTMPVGVMVALVAYTLVDRMGLVGGGDAAAGDPGGWWAAPLALTVTVILHLWRRNAAVSILAGTALYVVLVNVVA
ncbi:branched-chain amino acid ABC transporter permease [Corynebacterium xerosis]|uniref:Branched-chain amino acid ABC transporter permease n=1 Tax=Corynebacterium xerosis TaxID=1725 RepID=A0A6B8TP01_9CORY|nr:AzlD domain-containing protein [Corynebacterium xerosis]QGS34461.1 branched-chain amino acid ABC transporter permease [Corynebacterium xerosis]